MPTRNFDNWLGTMRESIADYAYYVDFAKVYENVENIKIKLNILNSLVGSRDIRNDFLRLVGNYPEILTCIPILIAVRESEIRVIDNGHLLIYDFRNANYSAEQYAVFMEETGLFNLLENHVISNLVDYVTGVETGLDSNSRKNRGGHIMENLVEHFIQEAGFVRDETYFKEMYASEIQEKWCIDISAISNNGTADKRFDFVVKTENCIYGIETNFYRSGGSKLNETARSYKTITVEANNIVGFKFVWFTDGIEGWKKARNNLKETFDVLTDLYNIADMENGVMNQLFR